MLLDLEQQLANLLVRQQLVAEAQMANALSHHQQTVGGATLDTSLLELGLLDEPTLTTQLAQLTGLPPPPESFAPPEADVAAELRTLIPMESALAAGFVPLRVDRFSLMGVTSLKADPLALSRLSGLSQRSLTTFVVPEVRVYQAAAAVYGVQMPARYAALVTQLAAPAKVSAPAKTLMDGSRSWLTNGQPAATAVAAEHNGVVPGANGHPEASAAEAKSETAEVKSETAVAPTIGVSTGDGSVSLGATAAEEQTVATQSASNTSAGAAPANSQDPPTPPAETQAPLGDAAAPAPAESVKQPLLDSAQQRIRAVDSLVTPLTVFAAADQLRRNVTRDAVFELLVRGALGLQLDYAAVFTVQGANATGRIALTWPGEHTHSLASVEVSMRLDHCLSRAVASRSPYVTGLTEREDLKLLKALQRGTPAGGIAVPILIGARTVALLYGERSDAPVDANVVGDFMLLATEAGKAFLRLASAAKSSTAKGQASSSSAAGDSGAPAGEPSSGAVQGVGEPVVTPRPAAAQALSPLLSNATPNEPIATEGPVRPSPLATHFQFVPVHIDHFTGPTPGTRTPLRPTPAPAAPSESDFGPTNRFSDIELASSKSGEDEGGAKLGSSGAKQRTANTPPPGLLPSAASLDDGSSEFKAIAAWVEASPELGVRAPGSTRIAGSDSQMGRPEAIASDLLASEGPLPAPPDATMRALLRRFPGELKIDRIHHPGHLPPASQHSSLLRLLSRFGEATTPYLAPLLESGDANIRFYATALLTELISSPEPVVRGLFARVFDGDGLIRTAAAEALRIRILDPNVAPYIARLREELEGVDRYRIRYAASALGDLRDTDSIVRLIDLVGGRDADAAAAARRALSAITKQNHGTNSKRWLAWWDKHRRQPRVDWLFEGLSQDAAELRRSAFDELRALTNEHFGYEVDLPKRDREEARKRWMRWWETTGRLRFSSSTRVPQLGRLGPSLLDRR